MGGKAFGFQKFGGVARSSGCVGAVFSFGAMACLRANRCFIIGSKGPSASGECPIVQIVVRDNNVDQALKALKKKMQREGLFREMKRRNHFEKPSEKRAREKAEAVRRARKLARKRAQREGLLPKI